MDEGNFVANLVHSFHLILPEIVLVVTACVVFLGGAFRPKRHLWGIVSLVGIIVAACLIPLARTPLESYSVFVSPLLEDALAHYIRLVALGSGVIFVFFSWNEIEDAYAGDFFGCLLIVLAGLSLTGAANELITFFLALELISIPTYIMLYLPKHDDQSQEASLKYFMLSIFSSGILLFGFSYLYGLTGSTNLSVLLHTLHDLDGIGDQPLIALVAVIMVIGGLGFKIAAVPFHFYAPDVYQGTSNVMAAVLAFIPKAAGFVAIVRIFGFVLPPEITARVIPIGMGLSDQVPILLWFLAAITMFLGNMLALLQNNLRRIFAYSSVAHAGYMLIGLAAAPYLRQTALLQGGSPGPDGIEALLFYLVAYGAMTVGVFAVLAYLSSDERPVETVDDLAGVSKSHPGIALLMVLFLFSLIGIPFTAGFTGKLLIFFGAVGVSSAGHVTLFRVLAFLGVINAAIGAWYYLRIIAAMYLRTPVEPPQRKGTIPGFVAIALCAILTIGLSIPPGSNWLLKLVRNASGNTQERLRVSENAPPRLQVQR